MWKFLSSQYFLSPFFIFLKSLKTSFYPSLLPVHLKVFKKSFKKSFYPPLLPLHLKPQLGGELLAVHRLVRKQPTDLAWKWCKNIQIQIQIQKYKKVQRLVQKQAADPATDYDQLTNPIAGRRDRWQYTRGKGQRQQERSEERIGIILGCETQTN